MCVGCLTNLRARPKEMDILGRGGAQGSTVVRKETPMIYMECVQASVLRWGSGLIGL